MGVELFCFPLILFFSFFIHKDIHMVFPTFFLLFFYCFVLPNASLTGPVKKHTLFHADFYYLLLINKLEMLIVNNPLGG
ncbi:hypothetical protein A2Z00_05395 [Candidatus Gottesmanbacteria bacterium RBG_13_45_10]|uniref:Uncharacterized protein n=1 Tax=Candidatus Gottesmanbacteria bacterium RBG_13_45_10 TaxID=1798370 RepID=A0A1F5ZGX3_9BACT|nr:MAG: hypothetical protein A2Z00_05395 [Candidatus Gottesmanbacteria bacterium RBG_13_45_10]